MKQLLLALLLIPTICFSQESKRDTIPAMLIVSDTSHGSYTAMTSRVWWMKGYEVRFTNQYGYMNWVEHLDADKKRLPLSIAVWTSKELTPR